VFSVFRHVGGRKSSTYNISCCLLRWLEKTQPTNMPENNKHFLIYQVSLGQTEINIPTQRWCFVICVTSRDFSWRAEWIGPSIFSLPNSLCSALKIKLVLLYEQQDFANCEIKILSPGNKLSFHILPFHNQNWDPVKIEWPIHSAWRAKWEIPGHITQNCRPLLKMTQKMHFSLGKKYIQILWTNFCRPQSCK